MTSPVTKVRDPCDVMAKDTWPRVCPGVSTAVIPGATSWSPSNGSMRPESANPSITPRIASPDG